MNITIILIIVSILFLVKIDHKQDKQVKLFSNVCRNGKIVMISDNYYDIGRLLLLTIIVSNKNCTILITVKENITVDRQKWLIFHPYGI